MVTRRRAPRSRVRTGLLVAGVLLALFGLAVAGAGLYYLQSKGVTPRALGPYVERRSSGHNPVITNTGRWVGLVLSMLDRGNYADATPALPPLSIGAQPGAADGSGTSLRKLVGNAAELRSALATAMPGDTIVLLPGTYHVQGELLASRPGTDAMPIVVRVERPGTVKIEFDAVEGFKVLAPYWRFENLVIRGVCAQQEYCEHAFHVVGGAHHFTALNNTILDFNAHFKINGEGGRFPDAGLIEGNTLSNTAPRYTNAPVTPVDLVAANDWIVRRNLITDFVKTGGDQVSYGAFAKGAGARTLFERNVIFCEQHLRASTGQRVGLSFGGGATGKPYCRDQKCVVEHDQGTMRANLIASCSDAGIYVNASARSRLIDNTLIDTAGVQVRFPESSADIAGNLVDGPILARNGANLRLGENLSTPVALLYLGHHPQRKLFAAPDSFGFAWREAPLLYTAEGPATDLCGAERARTRRFGAFEDFAACLTPRR